MATKQTSGGKIVVSKKVGVGSLNKGVSGVATSGRGHLGHAKPMPHGTKNPPKS